MAVVEKNATSEQLAKAVVEGLQEKKGLNIKVIDLRKVHNAFTDFFIIGSGNSDAQVDALCDSVEDYVFKQYKEWPSRVEGKQAKEWILMDYSNVVVHIFKKARRDFYRLEELWGDGKITSYQDID